MSASADTEPVHTIAGLDELALAATPLAVFGKPIAHSLSPVMHNAALAEMAQQDSRFLNWRYYRFEVDPDDLRDALEKFHARGFRGINLTIPHKVQAVALVDEIDPAARAMGAVNTLLRTERGYKGYNTDGYGLEAAIHETLGRELPGSDVILVGAGGASRAIAVQCLNRGARSLWIGNRSRERLDELLGILRENLGERENLHDFLLGDPPKELPRKPIIVNATALGLKADDPTPLDLDTFEDGTVIYDTTYGVKANGLRRAADERGFPCESGLSMLAWQGARALEIWSGANVPATTMLHAAQAARGE